MDIQQFAAVLICTVLSFLFMEYYLEYIYSNHTLSTRGAFYFLYCVLLAVGIIQCFMPYPVTTLFLGVFVIYGLYEDVRLSFIFAISMSLIFWIFSGWRTEVLLYNIFVGAGICLLQNQKTKDIKGSILFHFSNILHITVVALCCELIVWERIHPKHIVLTFAVYFLSYFLSYCLLFIFQSLLGKINKRQYGKYLSPDFYILKEFREEYPKAYEESVLIRELAFHAAKELQCNDCFAALGGQYYNIGLLLGTEMLDNSMKLREKHHLPSILDRFFEELYGKDRIPTTKESAIILLAGLTISTISAVSEKGRKITSMDKFIEIIINNQLHKGHLNQSGLGAGDLCLMEHSFVQTLKAKISTK